MPVTPKRGREQECLPTQFGHTENQTTPNENDFMHSKKSVTPGE